MQTFLAIQAMLSGYKAYGVGVLMIGVGLYVGGAEGRELILQGLGVIALRAGISKLGS